MRLGINQIKTIKSYLIMTTTSVNDKLKKFCINDYCWTNQKFEGLSVKKKYFR